MGKFLVLRGLFADEGVTGVGSGSQGFEPAWESFQRSVFPKNNHASLGVMSIQGIRDFLPL